MTKRRGMASSSGARRGDGDEGAEESRLKQYVRSQFELPELAELREGGKQALLGAAAVRRRHPARAPATH